MPTTHTGLENKDLRSIAEMTAAATLNTGAFGPMEGKINRESVQKIITGS